MKTEVVEIKALAYDPNNARTHNTKNIQSLMRSLKKFKQQKPIVVDKNNVVIAGNGLLEAALKLGWKKIAVVRTSLTGNDAKAYAIADNRLQELSKFDNDIVAAQLKTLQEEDWDIKDVGFTDEQLDKLLEAPIKKEKKLKECPECGHEW